MPVYDKYIDIHIKQGDSFVVQQSIFLSINPEGVQPFFYDKPNPLILNCLLIQEM